MQPIIVERPYKFVPPHRGNWVPSLIQATRLVDFYLNRYEGIASYEIRGADLLRESIRRNHGVVLAPNHCRYADPIAMGWIAREISMHVFAMASWHLFNQSWLQSFSIRMCGGFSVYREGLDRKSLETAIEILVEATRPLVVFPEGTVFRSNDILQPLLDGVAFLARSAARKRQRKGTGGVVVHPIAIKYLFRGNLDNSVDPVIRTLEERLHVGRPYSAEPPLIRVKRLSQVLLAIKEIDVLGSAQPGTIDQRKNRLIDSLLSPLERTWETPCDDEKLIPRIKALRQRMVPILQENRSSDQNRNLIWAGLRDIYLAQQIASHPSDYLDQPTETRILETVERLEEDVCDRVTVHRPLHAILEVGPAIEVATSKPPKGGPDPLMSTISGSLTSMLEQLSLEARSVRHVE